jgi:hypothetical protein
MTRTESPAWSSSADPFADNEVVQRVTIRAIHDARQTVDLKLQGEALAWLWVCCPDLADELELPTLPPIAFDLQAIRYLDRFVITG